MVEQRGEASLPREHGAHLGLSGVLLPKELEHDQLVKPRGPVGDGKLNERHAPFTDVVENPEPTGQGRERARASPCRGVGFGHRHTHLSRCARGCSPMCARRV